MTITSWRIVQAGHLHSAFTGEGARLYPGRWNLRGTPMVYTAASLSLAAMEMLVHLDTPDLLALYVSIPIHFDDSLCKKLEASSLPRDWADDPPPVSTQSLGTAWVDTTTSAVLAVPSAIVHVETNFLLNPLHPGFASIQIGTPSEFEFDPRLVRKL